MTWPVLNMCLVYFMKNYNIIICKIIIAAVPSLFTLYCCTDLFYGPGGVAAPHPPVFERILICCGPDWSIQIQPHLRNFAHTSHGNERGAFGHRLRHSTKIVPLLQAKIARFKSKKTGSCRVWTCLEIFGSRLKISNMAPREQLLRPPGPPPDHLVTNPGMFHAKIGAKTTAISIFSSIFATLLVWKCPICQPKKQQQKKAPTGKSDSNPRPCDR